MTFLPIVVRELRVAARKRSTAWLRAAAVLVGVLMGAGVLTLTAISGSPGSFMGAKLFAVLTWLSFAGVLLAGLFLTSDCLSEEKREGTLGLLFLTDLRGYDVVLGKLLATSLRVFYALLAVFPVLAVALILGGVTGGQFWKTALALVNALVYSLSVGMLVSSLSRDSQRAMSGMFWLMLLILVGLPVADGWRDNLTGHRNGPLFHQLSPFFVFNEASAWGRNHYWSALPLNLVAAAVCLLLASLRIPHAWQDRTGRVIAPKQGRTSALKYGTSRRRVGMRRKLLDLDPVIWLACRERWQVRWVWAAVLLAAAAFVLIWEIDAQPDAAGWGFICGFLTLILYLGASTQGSRFFVEARRSGLIELLLATPLDSRQIVRGHWRGIVRQFALPVLLVVLIHVAGSVIFEGKSLSVVGLKGNLPMPNLVLVLFTALGGAIGTLGNFAALIWFGMWMGMTSKTNNLAALKTLFFVQIIPWLVFMFIAAIGAMLVFFPVIRKATSGASSTIMVSFPIVQATIATLLTLGKDAAVILWSRKQLYTYFRQQASLGATRRPRTAPPPPLPPPLAPPPIAAAQV